MKILIHRFKRSIKFWWQRLTRGWDDRETWSLDTSIAKLILPRLKRFKEVNISYPHELTFEQYNEILQKIIDGLEWKVKQWYTGEEGEQWNTNYKKYREALNLLVQYFDHLWW